MIRSSVTIALVPEAKGGPFVFWDDLASGCAKAAELGFDGVEVFPKLNFRTYSPNTIFSLPRWALGPEWSCTNFRLPTLT